MNIAGLLLPKSTVAYLYDDFTLRQALEKMRYHGYTLLPVITRDNRYFGTISEGDLLWYFIDEGKIDLFGCENVRLRDAIKMRKFPLATIDMNIRDEVAGEIEGTYTATVEEFYPQTNYYADSKEVTLEEYYALFDSFSDKCIRIPETELRMIYWHEVSEKEDDRVTRAQKMVEALLSSPQKFIVP